MARNLMPRVTGDMILWRDEKFGVHRQKKIASLKKQIARLEAKKF